MKSIFPYMPAHNPLRVVALGLAALFIQSCSSIKVASASPDKVCREKFEVAKAEFAKGKDPEAQEKLRDISVNCVGYDFAEDAQYLLGESHFRNQQWIESETEFQILVDHWERSKYYQEARWKICRAAFLQAPTWDRDPSLTQQALEKEDAFLSDFPKGERADSARDDRDDLLGRLADRNFETANLYLKMDEPQAATIYYKLLFKEFPESNRIPVARLNLARAYAELDQFDQARASLDSLRQDSTKAGPLLERIDLTEKFVAKAQRKFEAQRVREAAEARQGKL